MVLVVVSRGVVSVVRCLVIGLWLFFGMVVWLGLVFLWLEF